MSTNWPNDNGTATQCQHCFCGQNTAGQPICCRCGCNGEFLRAHLIPASSERRPAEPTRCVMGEYCRTHGFIHGAEAEELREKFEALAADENTPSFQRRRIRGILDVVDARDSCVAAAAPAPPQTQGETERKS